MENNILNIQGEEVQYFSQPHILGYMLGFEAGARVILQQLSQTEWLKDYDIAGSAREFGKYWEENIANKLQEATDTNLTIPEGEFGEWEVMGK